MKHSVCTVKGCPFEGGYCRIHAAWYDKQPRKIKKESKKRAEVKRKEYLPIVAEMLNDHPACKVKSPVCTGKAQGLHHLHGREGQNYTDKRLLVPCCHACNGFIEANDLWARNNGWKLSKHQNYKRSV